MKRISLALVICIFLTGELMAQESSRRTRQLQPTPGQNHSASDQLHQQARQLEEISRQGNSSIASNSVPVTTSHLKEATSLQNVRVASLDNSAVPKPPSSTGPLKPSQPLAPIQPNATKPEALPEVVVDGGKSITTRIVAVEAINVGEPADLILTSTNTGQSELSAVNLVVHLPEHVELIDASPRPTERAGATVVWQLPVMAVGQQSEIRIQVVPHSKHPVSIATELTVVERSRVEIDVRQPEVKMVVEASDKAIVGQKIAHHVRIWNEGDGIARNLQIRLGLTPDMSLVDASEATMNVGALQPGEVRELILETQSTQAGVSPVVYRLAGNRINVEHSGNVHVVVPELYAEILGPKVNIPNREGTYTINVNNPCEIAINDTRVTLQIPDGMEVTLLSREGDLDEKTRSISWDMATMEPGASESLQFKARLTGNDHQQCHVTVESREASSSKLAFETRAHAHTDLTLAMKNLTGPVNVGETARFMVVATNSGHAAAGNVQIEIEIPEWIKPSPDESFRYDAASSRLIFNPVDIPAGTAAELRFAGTCENAGSFVVRSLLNHNSQSQPMISDASVFVLDTQTERVGSVVTPDQTIR